MTERRTLRDISFSMGGLMRSADAVEQEEAVLARDGAKGGEAARIRERLALLAAEKDRLEARLAELAYDVPAAPEENPREGLVSEHSPAREAQQPSSVSGSWTFLLLPDAMARCRLTSRATNVQEDIPPS